MYVTILDILLYIIYNNNTYSIDTVIIIEEYHQHKRQETREPEPQGQEQATQNKLDYGTSI